MLALAYGGYSPVKAEGKNYSDYVNPLMGTLSEHQLSTGNTYPAIARPWGMNFWMPQTGKMGDGWAYVYDNYRLRGFKQTHQPSPWINDYGMFAIMPVKGMKINEEERASCSPTKQKWLNLIIIAYTWPSMILSLRLLRPIGQLISVLLFLKPTKDIL